MPAGGLPNVREIAKEFGALGLLGMRLERYGCAGMSAVDYGSASLELEVATPARARCDGPGQHADWILDGTRTWITNEPVADVAVVWAQTDEGISGFVVPTDTPGFSTSLLGHKMSMRGFGHQ